jgi:WD40 repeat protein
VAVAFSPDGHTALTGGDDKTARLWDAATGEAVGRPLPHRNRVVAVAFGAAGGLLVTASADGTASLWEPRTGQPVGPPLPGVAVFFGTRGEEMAVAFRDEGRTLLTWGGGTVRPWPVPVPLEGESGRVRLWAEATTGMELDAGGAMRLLDVGVWQGRARGNKEEP